MSMLVMPSYYESFGLAAAEAMACGAAVIISGKTGFGSTLRNGRDALVLDPINADTLFAACAQLLSNTPLRVKIAESGYRRVQSLRWESSIVKLETTYLDWLEEHRRKCI